MFYCIITYCSFVLFKITYYIIETYIYYIIMLFRINIFMFRSCDFFELEVVALGVGQTWQGGDMNYPGIIR